MFTYLFPVMSSLKNTQLMTFSLQEFSKEVEGKSSLKSSVVSEGNQLLRLKKVDTVALRSDLACIDSQWAELLTRIPVVQEKLHQVKSHAATLNRLGCFRANRITSSHSFTRKHTFDVTVDPKPATQAFPSSILKLLLYIHPLYFSFFRSKWRSWPPAMPFLNFVTGFH